MNKTVTLFGSTGLIGGEVLKLLINDDYFENINIISRKKINIDSLSLDELRKFDKNITAGAKKVLSAINSVNSKTSFGGTAPKITKKMIKFAIKKYL